jgi:protein-L-isoaspartate(D-aspartate) O-methyltransferase
MTVSRSNAARINMINGQITTGDVNDDTVLEALSGVERELFVPDAFKKVAYVDDDLSLGNGRFLIEPLVFARMLKHARIQKTDTVLDIGCATGYSSAVLSKLAQGVIALEEDHTLADKAKTLLVSYPNVFVTEGSLVKGSSKQSPYDVIFIEGAIEVLPDAIAEQLAEGGRLMAIERVEEAKTAYSGLGKLVEYKKIKNVLYKTVILDANAVLIPAFKKAPAFKF